VLALLRYILIAIGFLVVNAIVLVACILRPFHRDNVHFAGQMYSKVSWLIGVRLQMEIDPAIQKNTPYVYIANHQNSYDIFTVCKAAMPGVVTIGKKSLKWIPIFGQIYFLSGNIMIDRKNSGKAKGTLSKAAKRIREKALSVWFFPEGTRSYGRGLLPFKSGAFRLALETEEPVVMVCMSSTHNKIKLNRWNNGTIFIKLCAPEKLDDSKTPREWSDYFHGKMKAEIAQLDERQQ
jgi:1-acyl-sn-glycerol-3-phosphate acyltransferase